MLTIQLDPNTERRLETLASRTGKSTSYYAQQAIRHALDDWEDVAVAVDRLRNPEERLTMEEVETLLGLED